MGNGMQNDQKVIGLRKLNPPVCRMHNVKPAVTTNEILMSVSRMNKFG